MRRSVDAVIGSLDYDYGWSRSVSVNFLGETCTVKLAFAGDEDGELDQGQRDAFVAFWSLRGRLLEDAEHAIFSHYQAVRPDVLARVPPEVAVQVAPPVAETGDLRRVVRLESLFFPEDFGSEWRVVGLLADCSWDPSLGLAVRFEDEHIVEVGPQDIVL